MKWKRKTGRQPQYGDTRIRRIFLWLPICFGEDCRWLSFERVREELSEAGVDGMGGYYVDWVFVGWAD